MTKNTTLYTYNQKISHLKALYHLACADNDLSKVELVYIRKVAEGLGIDPKELENFDSSEPELELPDKEYKIYSLFHRFAIIVMVDNAITEKEKQYCFNLGVKMGLHPNAVNEIVEYTIANGAMAALPDRIMAIFKKYSN